MPMSVTSFLALSLISVVSAAQLSVPTSHSALQANSSAGKQAPPQHQQRGRRQLWPAKKPNGPTAPQPTAASEKSASVAAAAAVHSPPTAFATGQGPSLAKQAVAAHQEHDASADTAGLEEAGDAEEVGEDQAGDAATAGFEIAADNEMEVKALDAELTTGTLGKNESKSEGEGWGMMDTIIVLLKSMITRKEFDLKYDGSADRGQFCQDARAAHEKAIKSPPKADDSFPKYKNEAIKGLLFTLAAADQELKFLCEDYVQFKGRHVVTAEHLETMKETLKEFESSMTCQAGDRLCVGGQLGGLRLDTCACTCDKGWGNGKKDACELCNDIQWEALPWKVIQQDLYSSGSQRTCPREGKRTREVSCNCASPKEGVHFDTKRCDAHPNRLASEESCTYEPLKIVSRQENMCLSNPVGSTNVMGEACGAGTDLSKGFYFESSQIRHERSGKCLTFDTKSYQRTWWERECTPRRVSGYRSRCARHHAVHRWYFLQRRSAAVEEREDGQPPAAEISEELEGGDGEDVHAAAEERDDSQPPAAGISEAEGSDGGDVHAALLRRSSRVETTDKEMSLDGSVSSKGYRASWKFSHWTCAHWVRDPVYVGPTCRWLQRSAWDEGNNVELQSCNGGSEQRWRKNGESFENEFKSHKCIGLGMLGAGPTRRDSSGFHGGAKNAIMVNCGDSAAKQWSMEVPPASFR